MARSSSLLLLPVLILVCTPIAAPAGPAPTRSDQHIRTTDGRLRRLVRDGVTVSATLRALVERLQGSDVVVYLDCGGVGAPSGGRLTFVSAVAGRRYVHVHVAYLGNRVQQIAMIGHELQHAVEIADAPTVVDGDTLVQEYVRIGFLNRRVTSGIAFDSQAAIAAGYQVLDEMAGTEDEDAGIRIQDADRNQEY